MGVRLPVVALAALLTARTSHAFVGSEPAVVAASSAQPRIEPRLIPARGLPSGWQGERDADTGVVAQLWGSHVDVPGASADAAIAERAARAFIAQHLDLLAPGASVADFTVVANRIDGDLRTVGFAQTWRGMRVVGGQIAVVIAHDRVFVVTSQALPAVTATVPPAHAVATDRATSWIAAQVRHPVHAQVTGERVVLPIVTRGGVAYHVADRLEAAERGGPGRWDVYVDASGAPLLRASTSARATATLAFDVGIRRPTDARHDVPAGAVNLAADGTDTTTAADGTFTWSGAAAATVVPTTAGTRVRVINEAGAAATSTLTAPPGGIARWSLASDAEGDAQLSTYIYGTIAKAWARLVEPALGAWLDQPLGFHVNVDGTCNASSTGNDVFFYKGAAGECENAGRLADVVFHELGHSVHFNSIIAGAGMFNIPMSEGLADFFAATLNEDPGIGRGFTFDDAPLRTIDPAGHEAHWPEDQSADPHLTGLIVGGALWDLRTALIAENGHDAGVALMNTLYVGVLQRSPSTVGAYLAALTADDDDGDLGNGTPHACVIQAAFGKHGLAEASFVTTTIGPPTADGLTIRVPVTMPTGTGCPVPAVTAITAAYHHGADAPVTVPLAPGATWSATLPAQPAGTVLQFTVTATLDDGSTYTFPNNPADPEYTLFVGPATPLWCASMDTDPMWTQADNMEWEWGPAGRNLVSGDPPTAHTGTNVLGLDLSQDGRYLFNDKTSITTPAIDASHYQQVHLQYWRWLTVEDGRFDQATVTVNGTEVWTNAMGFEHIDREWRFVDVDVTAQAASPLSIAWGLQSDGSRQLGGWTLDDVCVVGLGKIATCGDGVVDEGEACDDGGVLVDGHACTATCELVADEGGGCCSSSGGSSSIALGLGTLLLLRRRRLGSPVRRSSAG